MNFDVQTLADKIKESSPEVIFAFLMGSARDGIVVQDSDVDIALFISGKASLKLISKISDLVDSLATGAETDIGFLNEADPVYRFEALKGRLLFCRDEEKYLDFFSLTCREYESQIADYEIQKKYRSAG